MSIWQDEIERLQERIAELEAGFLHVVECPARADRWTCDDCQAAIAILDKRAREALEGKG